MTTVRLPRLGSFPNVNHRWPVTQEQFFRGEAKLISFLFKGQVARQPKFQMSQWQYLPSRPALRSLQRVLARHQLPETIKIYHITNIILKKNLTTGRHVMNTCFCVFYEDFTFPWLSSLWKWILTLFWPLEKMASLVFQYLLLAVTDWEEGLYQLHA